MSTPEDRLILGVEVVGAQAAEQQLKQVASAQQRIQEISNTPGGAAFLAKQSAAEREYSSRAQASSVMSQYSAASSMDLGTLQSQQAFQTSRQMEAEQGAAAEERIGSLRADIQQRSAAAAELQAMQSQQAFQTSRQMEMEAEAADKARVTALREDIQQRYAEAAAAEKAAAATSGMSRDMMFAERIGARMSAQFAMLIPIMMLASDNSEKLTGHLKEMGALMSHIAEMGSSMAMIGMFSRSPIAAAGATVGFYAALAGAIGEALVGLEQSIKDSMDADKQAKKAESDAQHLQDQAAGMRVWSEILGVLAVAVGILAIIAGALTGGVGYVGVVGAMAAAAAALRLSGIAGSMEAKAQTALANESIQGGIRDTMNSAKADISRYETPEERKREEAARLQKEATLLRSYADAAKTDPRYNIYSTQLYLERANKLDEDRNKLLQQIKSNTDPTQAAWQVIGGGQAFRPPLSVREVTGLRGNNHFNLYHGGSPDPNAVAAEVVRTLQRMGYQPAWG